MATKFLEPGGDATFNVASTTAGGFWNFASANYSVATDFVHGTHVKSIKPSVANGSNAQTKTGIMSDSGTRFSLYIYIVTLPSTTSQTLVTAFTAGFTGVYLLKIKTTGAIIITDDAGTQKGSDGATLATGSWYRVSVAYTVTSTTINRCEVFVDGVSSISLTNQTLSAASSSIFGIGSGANNDAAFDWRISDIYIDDSSSLIDTGDIWVTAKRPNANGTTNGFVTQIGTGGSSYGSGHSPQVNERALSTANGWSIVAVGVTTEEYNIERASIGDINIYNASIVDYIGWVYASALISETASIIVNNATSNISLTSTNTMFTRVAGSTTYPAGTGTDIGIITDATATTVSLYECGVIIAYIPGAAGGYLKQNRLRPSIYTPGIAR